MKKVKKSIAKMAIQVARAAMDRNANQTTCNIIFQPKVPAGLSNFKKVKR